MSSIVFGSACTCLPWSHSCNVIIVMCDSSAASWKCQVMQLCHGNQVVENIHCFVSRWFIMVWWLIMMHRDDSPGWGVWVFQEWTHTLHNGISSFCSWAHAEHMCIDKRAKPQTCHGQITRTPFETIRSQDYERRSNIVQRLSNTCEKYVPRITIWCSHRVMCNTALSNTCEKYVPRITIRCSHRVRCNTDMHNLLLGFGTPKHLFCLTYMVDTACIWHICCISARRNNMFVWRMWLKLHAFDMCFTHPYGNSCWSFVARLTPQGASNRVGMHGSAWWHANIHIYAHAERRQLKKLLTCFLASSNSFCNFIYFWTKSVYIPFILSNFFFVSWYFFMYSIAFIFVSFSLLIYHYYTKFDGNVKLYFSESGKSLFYKDSFFGFSTFFISVFSKIDRRFVYIKKEGS